MTEICILVASSNNNQKLALKLKELALNNSCKAEIINLVDLNLPLYTTKEEEKNGISKEVIDFAKKLLSYKTFIVVAPEYNGVMPATLNNAIAWASRATQEWRETFNEKIVALATHSGGGGHKVLAAMRLMFQHLGANVLSREILTSYEKVLNENSALNIIEQIKNLSK